MPGTISRTIYRPLVTLRKGCFGAWGAVLGMAFAGCAAGPSRAEHTPVPPRPGELVEPGPPPPPPLEELACPMLVEGTDVQAVPLDSGVALVFTSPLASAVPLRARVRSFAATYDTDGTTMLGPPRRGRSPAGFPTRAQYAEVAAGGRVEIRPVSLAHLDELRAHVRDRAAYMSMNQDC